MTPRRMLVLVGALALAGYVMWGVLSSGGGATSRAMPAVAKPGRAPAAAETRPHASVRAAQGVAGEVRTAEQLLARARGAGSAGKTFHVRAGQYGELDLRDVRQARLVTFRAYPGERPVLGYTQFQNSQGLRFEGVHFEGAIDIQEGDNSGLQFVRNDIGGYTDVGINIRERTRDVLIQGNYIHDLSQRGGSFAAGFGIRVAGARGPVTNLHIVGNTITRTANDGMELGGLQGGLIEGNDVSRVFPEPGSGEHADPFFLWSGSRGVVVRRNHFHDNEQPVYLGPDTYDVTFENNVVVKTENWCIQAGLLGYEGGDVGIHRHRIRNNTLWDCGFGGLLVRGRGGGNVLINNVLQSLEGEGLDQQFALEDHNLVGEGRRAGRHDVRRAPQFVNPARLDYRLAPGSPGIDAGTSVDAPTRDRVGARRSDDPSTPNTGTGAITFYDVGAYERFVAPELRNLSTRPARRRRLRVAYTLSVPARVTFTLKRRRGRRYRTVARFSDDGGRGRNRSRFSVKRLRRGSYRLGARAADPAGNRSARVRARFRVRRR